MRTLKYRYCIVACLIILLSSLGISLRAQQQSVARVNSLDLTLQSPTAWKSLSTDIIKQSYVELVLKVSRHPDAEQKALWEQHHIYIVDYLGNHLYAVWLDKISDFAGLTDIEGIAVLPAQAKMTESVAQKRYQKKTIECLVSFYPSFSLEDVKALAEQLSASLLYSKWQTKGMYLLQISPSRLLDLAGHYAVRFVGEPSTNQLLDLDSKGGHVVSRLALPVSLGGKNLKGTGVVIGHGDNCSGIYHIDQTDRTINYNTGDKTSHGVLTHGIISGDGIMNPAGQGIATDAKTISMYFDDILLAKDELGKGFNVNITNNSYAAIVGDCSYSGTYDNISQYLDSLALALPEQLDVFAAGNDGRLVCGAYPSGYYNICGGFQTAKNILSVGATNRELVLGDGSSRGPIRDGRLKPEITANGIDIMCPVPDNTYTVTRGTSLSCPQVTGVLALLTERYRQLNGGTNPKSDLLKALVMNAGIDLGNPGPDYQFGYGLLNASRAAYMLENGFYRKSTIASGDAPQQFTISVPTNVAQLKVMLYYHDPYASASAASQLVNDLDLSVATPSAVMHYPLVLDPSPGGVANAALEGIDHLNNSEQVVINNPGAGTYTINVADFDIPQGPQEYTIVYDILPKEITISYPQAYAAVAASNDLYIYWDAPYESGTTPIKIDYSTDGGASWLNLTSSLASNTKVYKWAVPLINSKTCRLRISRGTLSTETGDFVIHQQPSLSLSPDQCPGAINFTWSAITGASKYYILLKKGAHYQKIDSVNASTLSYAIRGLNTSETYYVSLLPAFGTQEGYRSNALVRKPNSGTCAALSKGDLSMEAILLPNSGRRFTSTELVKYTPIKVRMRNQSDFYVGDYSFVYQINGGAWKSSKSYSASPLALVEQIIDSADFRDTITYELKIAVQNNDMTDPVHVNDTLVKVFKHIPNSPVYLESPYLFDFESMPDITMRHDTVGLEENNVWDYQTNNDTGRLRSFLPGSRLLKSTRSISMDVGANTLNAVNYLTATVNLSNYDTSLDELRFDFDYEMRGMPALRDSNKVWVRANDTAKWLPVFVYTNVTDTAALHHSEAISLREAFKNNHQAFSSSVQVRFGQYDSTVIVDDFRGGGLSLDNIRFFKVVKDVQLQSILSPAISECAVSSAPVSVRLKNGTLDTLSSISVTYVVDGKTPVQEDLTESIPGDDSVDFTFSLPIAGLSKGKHSLDVWVSMPGDDYKINDTIRGFEFTVSDMIDNFPYLQNFENSNGEWYVEGVNASWAYGTPASDKIHTAASGSKAWKTNLNGNYNSSEQSYLVSPCISTLSLSNPTLSFSLAFDIEDCAAPCDGLFMECTLDNGASWNKLGFVGLGTNWYNNTNHVVWNGSDTRWHVATIALPRVAQMKLRFNFRSDVLKNLEGAAVDDIHIYDLTHPIADMDTKNSLDLGTQQLHTGKWVEYLESTSIGAALRTQTLDGENVGALVYKPSVLTDMPYKRQYIMPRSFAFKGTQVYSDSLDLRLYISDAALQPIWDDTTCLNCSRAEDIYRVGISQFNEANLSLLDSSALNNLTKSAYYKYQDVQWVPYDKGYFAAFRAKGLGEFWLNDGGLNAMIPAYTDYARLQAKRLNADAALLQWSCPVDSLIATFVLQRSLDSLQFDSVASFPAHATPLMDYAEQDIHGLSVNAPIYYRLYCISHTGKTFYSNVASVSWSNMANELVQVYPNPSSDGLFTLLWVADEGLVSELTITDMTGRLIEGLSLQSTQWYNRSQLSLQSLSKGVYFLKMKIGERIFTQKLLFR